MMKLLKNIIGYIFAGLFLVAALPMFGYLLTLTLTGKLLQVPGI